MRKATATLGAAVVTLATVVGVTAAAFNDTERARAQTSSSGTVSLDLRSGTGAAPSRFNIESAERGLVPGVLTDEVAGRMQTYQLRNAGTRRGRASTRLDLLTDVELGCSEPELPLDRTCRRGAPGELFEQLLVTVHTATLSGTRCNLSGLASGSGRLLDAVPLSRLAGTVDLGPALAPGQALCVRFRIWLPDRPDNNVAQSDLTTFDLHFDLAQA